MLISVRDIETPTADPVARAATPLFGGPLGRYARVGDALPWQPAATVLTLVAAVMVALGMLQKGYCTANGWGVPDVFWRACYSDLPYLFSATPLADGSYPYPATGSESAAATGLAQPPLTGALLWLLAVVVPDGTPLERQRFYVLAWAVVLVAILALLVRVTARSCRRDPWRAAHVAASPLLVTVALVSPDLFGVMLASCGLYLWSRNRPELAGVLFGLAIAARTYPVLLVLVIGLLAVRAGRFYAWAALAGTALLSYVGSLLVISAAGLLSGGAHGLGDLAGLLTPYRQWASAGPDYGSLWYLLRAAEVSVTPEVAVALAVSGWVLALGLGAAVALSAPRRPTIAEVALIVVGVVLVTGRSLPVQASLWLVPLVALAGLRWRDHLVWAGGEVLYFVAIWLYLGGQSDPSRGLPLPWLMAFSVLRLGGIGWLVVAAWRQAVRRVPAPESYVEAALATRFTRGGPGGAGWRPPGPGDAGGAGRVGPTSGAGRLGRRPVVAGSAPELDVPSDSGPDDRTPTGSVPQLDVPSEPVTTGLPLPRRARREESAAVVEDMLLDASLEPDPLAGPLTARPDALTIALR